MICPDCKNSFLQPFVCTTCGAEKLYDTTVVTLQNQLATARNDALEEAAKICDEYANKGVVGARICAAAICATKQFGAHIKEMHEFIAENQRLIKLSEGTRGRKINE